jgi:ABC-2 type transport system ATP-binding protein
MATLLERNHAAALLDESSTAAVRVENLWKKYGALEAVRGVSLNVKQGEIFGLIGPDGAGKTSTFQILGGVMPATSGVTGIYGKPSRDARSQVGYLTQSFSLYPDLSVAENIRYVGDLRRVPPEEIRRRGHQYLSMFDMDRFANRMAGKLSGGMKQKLSLVAALVAQPRVLLLDEPTTGVDPVSRREFWDTLAHLADEGLTIVVATPYLDEAERCHRVAFMHLGQIHQAGTPAELRSSLNMKRLEVRTDNLGEAEIKLGEAEIKLGEPETTPVEAEAGSLPEDSSKNQISDVQRFGDRLDVMVRNVDQGRNAIQQRLRGMHLEEIRVADPTLENIFVATLRSLGHEMHAPAYPGRHPHGDLRGQMAINAQHLTKRFGNFTAVKDINIHVNHGEIYGLLGANGAGKTTAIKMLCGLIEPTDGEMTLVGESGSLRSNAVRERIGYMSQKFSLYDDLTINENLDFFGGVYGVPEAELAEKKKWVMSFSGLEGKEQMITRSLPGGWKQRVAFGAAIMHEPSVLFLDEPTSGVDPLARRAFWRMINKLADMGTAILVTTHYLEEAEQCNRLGFMVAGELVAEGTPSGVKQQQGGHLLEFTVDHPQRAADFLKQHMDRWRVSLFGPRLHVITDDDAEIARRAVTGQLGHAGVKVLGVSEETYSLEDVFIAVVEKARAGGKFSRED